MQQTTAMNQAEPVVGSGAVIAFRLFDIAYAIDLAKVESVWAARARTASRGRLTATPPKAVAFDVPPVSLVLDPVTFTLDGSAMQAEVTARVYDFGAISIALRVPTRDIPWSAFVARMNAVDRAVGQTQADPWTDLLQQLRTAIAPALVRPEASSALQEDYLIGVVHRFDQDMTAVELQARVDLVPLLSGEQPQTVGRRAAGPAATAVFLLHRRSRRAHLGSRFHLRAARRLRRDRRAGNSQRPAIGDALLRRAAGCRAAADVRPGGSRTPQAAPACRAALRQAGTSLPHAGRGGDRADREGGQRVAGHRGRLPCAGLQRGADLFRVSTVSAAVDRKLAIMRDTYSALYDEAQSSRAELLEVLIVLLIVVEIALAVIRP